jgi:hypothetical protein
LAAVSGLIENSEKVQEKNAEEKKLKLAVAVP